MLRQLALSIFCLPIAADALAAEIEVVSVSSGEHAVVVVSGEISEGDALAFSEATSGIERATVVVQGPGGLVDEALSIGADINLRSFATLVAPGTECYSACALIWLGGKRRYTSDEATIGVHAAYYEGGDGSLRISGAGNAVLGAYLAQVGLRREAIQYITTAEPEEDFLYLTPDILRLLGVDIYEQEGEITTTPTDAPTAPTIAYTVSQMIALEVNCGELMNTQGQAQRSAEALLRQGHEVYGVEVFAGLIAEAAEATNGDLASRGPPDWCLGTTSSLLQDGYDLGIDGPSFECSRAETTNERSICDTPALWGFDRALSVFYTGLRYQTSTAEKLQLRADQAAWLKRRQACGSNVNCTADLYYSRISEFVR